MSIWYGLKGSFVVNNQDVDGRLLRLLQRDAVSLVKIVKTTPFTDSSLFVQFDGMTLASDVRPSRVRHTLKELGPFLRSGETITEVIYDKKSLSVNTFYVGTWEMRSEAIIDWYLSRNNHTFPGMTPDELQTLVIAMGKHFEHLPDGHGSYLFLGKLRRMNQE